MQGATVNTIATVATLLVMASSAEAQHHRRGPGGFVGVSFVAANAVGDWSSLVDHGFGVEVAAGAPMAADGMLRLRADLGAVVYGIERVRYCGVVCRVGSDLTTMNSVVYGGVGPELVLGSGDVRPYVHAAAGLSYFVTSSSIDDNDGYGPYLETTNYSDLVFGWRFGGGMRLRVGGGHRPVFVDVGVERHDNGIASYLTEGDIVDHPDGTVTLYPNRSEANLVSFRLGVSFALH